MSAPTSFRFPFKLPPETHPQVEAAIRYAFSGIKDLNDAVGSLNTKVNENTGAVSTVTQTVQTISAGGGSTPVAAPSTIGLVNMQPNPATNTSYIVQQSDYGALIAITPTSAFALTLNGGLASPYYTLIYNFGTFPITATPDTGTVNNAASVRVLPNQFAMAFFDSNRNWWMLVTPSTVGLQVFANNAAAVAGGLSPGDLYRTNADPDVVCVVH